MSKLFKWYAIGYGSHLYIPIQIKNKIVEGYIIYTNEKGIEKIFFYTVMQKDLIKTIKINKPESFRKIIELVMERKKK